MFGGGCRWPGEGRGGGASRDADYGLRLTDRERRLLGDAAQGTVGGANGTDVEDGDSGEVVAAAVAVLGRVDRDEVGRAESDRLG